MRVFLQAEDGIRGGHVTGVQTCALPIYPHRRDRRDRYRRGARRDHGAHHPSRLPGTSGDGRGALTRRGGCSSAGYQELLEMAEEHPPLRVWAVEGTGGHGAGLTHLLERESEVVFELDRPQRAKRRNGAKSDPLDAVRAAREAMARPHQGTPRTGQERQALSVLLAARRSAVDAATVAQRQLFSLTIAAPERLRAKLRDRKLPEMVEIASRFRVHPAWDVETATTARVLRDLARRAKALQAEADEHKKKSRAIVRSWRPDLLPDMGVGPIVAATVLCAWSHPGRVRDEAAFAMLAGVAPLPANSGKTITRYLLNRYCDRQLNRALITIVL